MSTTRPLYLCHLIICVSYNPNLFIGLMKFCAAYMVVADETIGRQTPFAFLERVKEDFKRRFGGGKADTAVAHSLDREFGYAEIEKASGECMSNSRFLNTKSHFDLAVK